jgi:hypothetical protein
MKVFLFCSRSASGTKTNFIPGGNEREESTQNTTVTKSAGYASYKIKATTQLVAYHSISATYTRTTI